VPVDEEHVHLMRPGAQAASGLSAAIPDDGDADGLLVGALVEL
jgi:hypothetical protein